MLELDEERMCTHKVPCLIIIYDMAGFELEPRFLQMYACMGLEFFCNGCMSLYV